MLESEYGDANVNSFYLAVFIAHCPTARTVSNNIIATARTIGEAIRNLGKVKFVSVVGWSRQSSVDTTAVLTP